MICKNEDRKTSSKLNNLLEGVSPSDIATRAKEILSNTTKWSSKMIDFIYPEILAGSTTIYNQNQMNPDDEHYRISFENNLCNTIVKVKDNAKKATMAKINKTLNQKTIFEKRQNLKKLAIQASGGGRDSSGMFILLTAAKKTISGGSIYNVKSESYDQKETIINPLGSNPVQLPPSKYSVVADYPDSYGMIDSAKNFIKVNQKTGDVDIVHNSGTKFKIDGMGNVTMEVVGSFKQVVKKDYFLQVEGNMELQVFGNYTGSIGGSSSNSIGSTKYESVASTTTLTTGGAWINTIGGLYNTNVGGMELKNVGSQIKINSPKSTLSGDHYAKSYNTNSGSGSMSGGGTLRVKKVLSNTAKIPKITGTITHAIRSDNADNADCC
jgi:hypothetical protein